MDGIAEEIQRARQAGVTHPGNLPFLLEPENPNGQAVLLIHGFCASPYEMRPVAEYLCAQGFLTLGVRLAGHGSTPEDLRNRSWRGWLLSLERGYKILETSGNPVSLVAQSTGALLGLTFSREKIFAKAVLLSPFLQLRHPLAKYAGILKHIIPFQQRQLNEPYRHHYYERRPLAGVEQIGRLLKELKPSLKEITTPTLILAAAGDQTVAPGTAQSLFHQLGGTKNEFHLYGSEVPHVLSTPENPCLADCLQRISMFLSEKE